MEKNTLDMIYSYQGSISIIVETKEPANDIFDKYWTASKHGEYVSGIDEFGCLFHTKRYK